MRSFFRQLLGIEYLKAQIAVLRQEVYELHKENERLQIKISGLGTHGKLDFSRSQASQLAIIVEDFRTRNGLRTVGRK